MMRFFLLPVTLISILLVSCHRQVDFSSLEIRNDTVYLNNDLFSGDAVESYGDSATKSERMYEKGLLEGAYIEYYPSGNLKSNGNYSDGMRQGEWTRYYENGELYLKGSFSDDKKTGTWHYWYNNN